MHRVLRFIAPASLALTLLPALARSAAPASASTPPSAVAHSDYRWEVVPDRSLSLIGAAGPVWRFNYDAGQTKPHFHPLRTADGRLLTWVGPEDHPWHYGLWHSWKYIDGVNYWEEDRTTGQADGTTRVHAFEVLQRDDRGARFRLVLHYHPAGRPGDVVLEQVVEVYVSVPDAAGTYRVDWDQETRARQRPVELSRTPLPAEPEGKAWGGYAGLTFRGAAALREPTVLNSEGQTGGETHRQAARWLRFTGSVDERPASVSFFDAPENPRHPTRWFVDLTPKDPFWFINAALVHDAPLRLEPGQPLRLRYRVRIDSTPPDAALLEEEFQRFSHQSR